MKKKLNLKVLATAVAVVATPAVALATNNTGAGASGDFTDVVTLITEWMTGTLGVVIALATFLVGLGIGIMQQSIMAVVIGIAMAIAVANGPAIIANIAGSGILF